MKYLIECTHKEVLDTGATTARDVLQEVRVEANSVEQAIENCQAKLRYFRASTGSADVRGKKDDRAWVKNPLKDFKVLTITPI